MTLARTTLLSGLETVLRLVAGFLVIKYVAVLTGPEGVALFGQFQNMLAGLGMFAGGALATGVVKHVAAKPEQAERYVREAIGLTLILSIVFGAVLVCFAVPLSDKILHNRAYAWILISTGLLLFPVAVYQVLIAVLNGRQQIDRYVLNRSVTSLTLLLCSLVLVTWIGVSGGLLSVVVAPAIGAVLGAILLLRNFDVAPCWLRPQFNWKGFRRYLPFWLMGSVTVLSTPTVLILIRIRIGNTLGWESAGHWEAAWRIAELCTILVTTALATYYVPRLSTSRSKREESILMKQIALFAVISTSFIAVVVYGLRGWALILLFSPEFAPAASLFAAQLAGTVVRIVGWTITYHMIVRARIGWLLTGEAVFGVLLYWLVSYGVAHYGLIGASYGFLMNASLFLIYCFVYLIAQRHHVPRDV